MTTGAGTYTSTTFSWNASPTNPSSYTITGSDSVGNQVTTALSFATDTTAPANVLSLSGQSGGGSFLSGTTVYYQGSTAGSSPLPTLPPMAAQAPPRVPSALGGTSTGWSFTGQP